MLKCVRVRILRISQESSQKGIKVLAKNEESYVNISAIRQA
jgi:hypothetical protein